VTDDPSAAAPASIPRRAVWLLGFSQLVCWGTTYYLVGAFASEIDEDFGRGGAFVQAGFSLALVVMALSSSLSGRMIDTHGGGAVMTAGSGLAAAGLAALALARTPAAYFGAWVVLGLAMRLTLYEAAFATLARIGGPYSGRAIAQVTLLGGLASTVFWPIGHALASEFGWRGAMFAYAGIAGATAALHLTLPSGRYVASVRPVGAAGSTAPPARADSLAAVLYIQITMMAAFLNSGMAAHMIGILTGVGLGATTAVAIASLRGIGQSLARLADVLFGRRIHPLDLNLAATAAMPACFIAGLWSGEAVFAGVIFAFLYGATNGIATITRGTLPLVLFDARHYGAISGRLLAPSFMAAAAAPFGYAWVIEQWGDRAGLVLSAGASAAAAAAAFVLRVRFRG
jgi:hypothetical protein